MVKKGLLERLREGPVVGDGGYLFTLEKRGYVMAGPYTTEAVMEHPEAVKQVHREFMRAGADVLQAFTFWSTDDRLALTGPDAPGNETGKNFTCKEVNDQACTIAKEVAADGDALVCGGLSNTPSYAQGKGKAAVQQEFSKQVDVFVEHDVDFLLAEFFGYVEEAEWAIEVLKARGKGKPVACTLRIGPLGDDSDVPPGECAVRMAKAGADVVGLNCRFDANTCLKTIKMMKDALDKEGLSPYLMVQPNGFFSPETEQTKDGWTILPEFPFALGPRQMTRFEVNHFVRAAFDLGVKYIGGCCGFEPHHIRAISEELSPERGGKLGDASKKHRPWGGGLKTNQPEKDFIIGKDTREYWESVKPAIGRPGFPDVQTKLFRH
ncbi:PREDICTED: betaine--homocysteine S-methyltransferase 1-like [Branchiostoma belcheri]|uniref:Betaine--homocysteine S-methyltransferase 1-like n=1 Tax=Branchiostoma belcheri TaxID=7741 RepID=A0A6P4Y6V6_BRABE|nr:PREDICTED: betaine--homocysteine S-methyltransferase 1-like [Branchiostoma belcheri]